MLAFNLGRGREFCLQRCRLLSLMPEIGLEKMRLRHKHHWVQFVCVCVGGWVGWVLCIRFIFFYAFHWICQPLGHKNKYILKPSLSLSLSLSHSLPSLAQRRHKALFGCELLRLVVYVYVTHMYFGNLSLPLSVCLSICLSLSLSLCLCLSLSLSLFRSKTS